MISKEQFRPVENWGLTIFFPPDIISYDPTLSEETSSSMSLSGFDDELKPDAEANRIISDPDLINIDIKELNKMLKEKGISKVIKQTIALYQYCWLSWHGQELATRLKQRRRTLKNRNYASSCREKKDEEILTLEKQKGSEVDEMNRMEEENDKIQKDIDQMKRKYRLLEQFAKDQNLEVIQ